MMQHKLCKRICILFLILTLTITQLPLMAAAGGTLPFKDVSSSAWYYDSVRRVYENGLFDGVTPTEFRPDGTVNRAMLVTVLYRLAGKPQVVLTTSSFNDLKAQWYRSPVLWAAANGIVTGYPDGTFRPTDNVSREQIATILYRYAAMVYGTQTAKGSLSGFPDASAVHNYAKDAVKWAVGAGLIGGVKQDGVNKLMPQQSATRAQAATMLCRLMDYCSGLNGSLAPVSGKVYTTSHSTTLHTQRSSSSSKIAVPYMTELTYVQTSGNWVEVKYQGKTYFIYQSGTKLTTDRKSSFTYTAATTYQRQLIDLVLNIYHNWPTKYAHQQSTGVPDSDGRYGFDCSGFAAYALDTTMHSHAPLYDVSANLKNLYATDTILNPGYPGTLKATFVIPAGQKLDESKLQPGDILFFNLTEESEGGSAAYNHCGIYLGKGEFIHCTHSWGGGVNIMPLSGIYRDNFVAAKRFLPVQLQTAEVTMTTTSRRTNVYPDKNSDLTPLDTLGIDEKVTLLFYNGGNWAYVRYNGTKTGFVLMKYLA